MSCHKAAVSFLAALFILKKPLSDSAFSSAAALRLCRVWESGVFLDARGYPWQAHKHTKFSLLLGDLSRGTYS